MGTFFWKKYTRCSRNFIVVRALKGDDWRMKGSEVKGEVHEENNRERVDIKSFIYFSISFIPFHIMNIITILITLCKYILSSEHRERWSRTPERTRSTRYIRVFCSAPNSNSGAMSLVSIEFFRKAQTQPSTSIHTPFSHCIKSTIESHLRFLSKFLKYLCVFFLSSIRK